MHKAFIIMGMLLAVGLIARGGIKVKNIQDDKIQSENSIPARFPGGDEKFYEFLEGNIRYPYLLAKIQLEGEVNVKFTINKDGYPIDIEIINGFDPLADDEVLRVIKKMPVWTSAAINGEKVDMQQKVSVLFSLDDDLATQTREMEIKGTGEDVYLKSLFEKEGKVDSIKEEREDEADRLNIDNNVLKDRLPEYPGGKEALETFLKTNLKYPKRAIELKVEGSVIFNVTVSAEGEISRISLIRGLYYECNDEAFYLVKKMPKWIPGLRDGKPVSMDMILPIPFKLTK